jgi:threonine dehydrogenase-like Zn-dependent dehydrogenase
VKAARLHGPADLRYEDVPEELTVRGSYGHAPRHLRAALAFLASDAYPWEHLITHEVGLPQLPTLFAEPPDDLLKAAVRP